MKKVIEVIGFPRSGNTWVARLLGDVLDSPVMSREGSLAIADEGYSRPGDYIIRQEHKDPKDLSQYGYHKVVLVIRDPRDVVVSTKHYWAIDTFKQAAISVLEGKWPTPQCGGWLAMYKDWYKDNSFDYLIKYENLLQQPEKELESMLDALDTKLEKNISGVVKRQSFAKRKMVARKHGNKMPHGRFVQLNALRKGVAGSHKKELTPIVRKYIEKRAENVAVKYGYVYKN